MHHAIRRPAGARQKQESAIGAFLARAWCVLRYQTEKEEPQPQVVAALGLLTTKREPIRPCS